MDSSETVQATFQVLLQTLSPLPIPVKRVRNLTRIVYVSAIAHTWVTPAQLAQLPAVLPVTIVAVELAKALGQWLQRLDFCLGLPIPLEAQPTLKIQATPSGLIEIEFTDWTIALWLAALLANSEIPPQPSMSKPKLQPETIFAAQHSYARCCSLLCLAHSRKLISLESLNSEPIDWQLNPSFLETNFTSLRFTPSAQHLLGGLFDIWEALFQPIVQPNKLLTAANQSFQRFHSDVQFFAPQSDPINWLLLLATQRVMYRLLETLHLSTPPTL